MTGAVLRHEISGGGADDNHHRHDDLQDEGISSARRKNR